MWLLLIWYSQSSAGEPLIKRLEVGLFYAACWGGNEPGSNPSQLPRKLSKEVSGAITTLLPPPRPGWHTGEAPAHFGRVAAGW